VETDPPGAPPETETLVPPYLMAVLASRFEAIIREMTNTVMKASRSAVIKNARDMSCGILTYDHRLLSVEEGIPIHITALDLTTRPITEYFDDIAEGDAFLNNCPYTGATHHADLTVCMPVFFEGEPLFWVLSRSHHADIGAPIPTTYLPYARTVYEEGLHFPCVRVQREHKDLDDIIRMCRMKIRVPDLWYGDYRAQVGACQIGERRIKELINRYGVDTIKAYVEEWMAYGERRAIAAIRELPKGAWSYETCHDAVPSVADDGVPVRVTVTVDPDEGLITVDARDNIDCVPGGINLTEATAQGSCRIGVFYNLDSSIPHNEGSASRIKVLLRDNCVVGRPKYPVGTSVATTNVNERLVIAVAACFAQMGRPYGMAEGGHMFAAGMAVISGNDSRKGDHPYVNQMFIGYASGPAIHGHDGWITYLASENGGMIVLDSIEIDESMYPIVVEGRWLECDTAGAGEFDGAPGVKLVYRPIADDMTVIYASDGEDNPGLGVLGGGAGAPAANFKRLADGKLQRLPAFHSEVFKPGEAVVCQCGAGGGYGDPRQRPPERVAASANRGWVSAERAESIYAVALRQAANGVEWEVDEARTLALRNGR
jgi:N-methylhydantoinase B/oxoprolinase/acetone carboxylase alpha subunit